MRVLAVGKAAHVPTDPPMLSLYSAPCKLTSTPTQAVVLLTMLFGTLLGACSSSASDTRGMTEPQSADAMAEAGTVVILSSRDEQFMDPLWDLVRQRHPELKLVVDYGKDAGNLDRIKAEREKPRVDLLISKGSAAVEAAAAEGLLSTLPAGSTASVPERFRGPENRWVGLSARARILVARKGATPVPTNIDALAEPTWKGKVGRTVATNSSFVGGIASLVASRGEVQTRAFLEGLKSNTEDTGLVFPKHTPTVASVAEGRAEIALVNHYYFYRNVLGKRVDPKVGSQEALAALEAAPIEALFLPTGGDGVAWNVSSGGLVEGSPNPAGAAKILQVLLSEEGQKIYAGANREYPVREGVEVAPGVLPPDQFVWASTPLFRLAELTPSAVRLIQEIGLK